MAVKSFGAVFRRLSHLLQKNAEHRIVHSVAVTTSESQTVMLLNTQAHSCALLENDWTMDEAQCLLSSSLLLIIIGHAWSECKGWLNPGHLMMEFWLVVKIDPPHPSNKHYQSVQPLCLCSSAQAHRWRWTMFRSSESHHMSCSNSDLRKTWEWWFTSHGSHHEPLTVFDHCYIATIEHV